MDDFFDRCDQPGGSLIECLERLLQVLLDRFGLQQATIELADGVRISASGEPRVLRRRAHSRSIDDAVRAAEWLQGSDGRMRRRAARKPTEVTLPLAYAGRELGALHLVWRETSRRHRVSDGALSRVAHRVAQFLHRYQARDWAANTLGAPLAIVGTSSAMQEAEGLLEAVAASDLPVLIEGEFGTEAVHFAALIHAGGGRRERAFVAVSAADPEGGPSDWFKRANGGTLFLDDVEVLSADLQGQLARHVQAALMPWPPKSHAHDVRVIAATSADLRGEVAAGRFARGLLAKLDVLSLRVPPLRERTEDLPVLVRAALARRGFAVESKVGARFMALLKEYSWPENLIELERVVTRLAVMTGNQPIREEDVLRLTPWISRAWRSPTREAAAFQAAREVSTDRGRSEHWVQVVLTRDLQQIARLHEGLRRALLWLAEHFAEPVSLERLAQEAHVSPSHLTFLFRENLSLSFKTLLTGLRVERAKQMFTEAPMRRVTEVAMTVGYSDLSHFERTFRRWVGRSPREFRRVIDDQTQRADAKPRPRT